MIEKNQSKEFEYISKAYEKSGGDVSKLLSKDIVSIIISGNKILGRNTVEGIDLKSEIKDNFVKVIFTAKDGVKLKKQIHLCVGYLEKFGEQHLEYEFNIGNDCSLNFLSHCTFPAAKDILHEMTANLKIGENSKVSFEDIHFHNEEGLVTLDTKYYANVGKNSVYDSRFKLVKTRIGNMKVLMDVNLEENAKTYLETKVKAKKDDRLEVNEIIRLTGTKSSGIAKSYVIAQDESYAKIVNEAYGDGDYSVGHIECTEIVDGNKVDVQTIPLLRVRNELSELTHEASVGRINPGQLETLMSKGLSEDEATELIIKGVLV
ncbi:hypothetical protein OSSY52_14070 [Tepiditoga spiralis]|uniref:SUF system FeS cluster assembly SufBD core domain-containing protein n=1 Tax=Tepiditoga spiralis TaxID=2108365 RepID=A0A7G1G7E4_9BACT|nr:SufD family Fe-S cluster assembly protein [Tepiditoga spiralis]BBE31266.1 hypothetical protein OSSY52_14070 [Tepiditoga spiralis]